MPDISMCDVKDCPKSGECYRHKDSGTKPNQYRQAYFVMRESDERPCENFWPTHENGKKVTP